MTPPSQKNGAPAASLCHLQVMQFAARSSWPALFVIFLLPAPFSAACATLAGPIHTEPVSPPIEQTNPPRALHIVPKMEPIAPDRPDVTNGTNIVETGLLQVEAGAQHPRMGTQRSIGTPGTVRIGLLEWLEARVGTDRFLHQTCTSGSAGGAGAGEGGAHVRW